MGESPDRSEEQLFLKEKLRQQRCLIRRSGNETETVAFCVSDPLAGGMSIFSIASSWG
jgi:hypothetical protein